MHRSARESEHYSLSAKHWSVIQSSDLHRCMQRAIFASKVQNEIQRCTNCRPYCQLSDAPIRARVQVLFAQHCSGTRSERRRLRARERAVPGACRGEPSPPRARERSPPYASERSPSRARAVPPAQCEGHAQRCRVAERTAERKRSRRPINRCVLWPPFGVCSSRLRRRRGSWQRPRSSSLWRRSTLQRRRQHRKAFQELEGECRSAQAKLDALQDHF